MLGSDGSNGLISCTRNLYWRTEIVPTGTIYRDLFGSLTCLSWGHLESLKINVIQLSRTLLQKVLKLFEDPKFLLSFSVTVFQLLLRAL